MVSRFIRAAVDGTAPIIQGDGNQTRDLIYIGNVVSALMAAAAIDVPHPLNIGSGEAIAISYLWTQVLELTGKRRLSIEPTYVPAPRWEPKHMRPQIQRACKVLNWAPSVRLREGLVQAVQHYLNQRPKDPNAWFSPQQPSPVKRPPPPPKARPRTPVPTNAAIGVRTPRPPVTPKTHPAPLSRQPEDVLPVADEDVIEDEAIDGDKTPPDGLDIAWVPVPSVPGLGG